MLIDTPSDLTRDGTGTVQRAFATEGGTAMGYVIPCPRRKPNACLEPSHKNSSSGDVVHVCCATSEVLVSRSDDFPEYRVDSITVGAASFEDLPVSGTPRAASGVDGFLGLPLYRNVLVTIDYAAGRLPSKGSSTRDRPALLG